MHGGRPAARHGDGLADDLFRHRALARLVAELHPTTPRMPLTPAMAVPVFTGMPNARASCGSGPSAFGRASTMQGTSSPAA
jgi:hypothetical protein